MYLIKIKVKELLIEHNMSQKELADATGIRPNTISAYFHNNIQRIDVDHLNEFCKVFKLKDISELIEYSTSFDNKQINFTPLVAFENAVSQITSLQVLTKQMIYSQQDFVFNLAIQAINYIFSSPNQNISQKDIQKLGYLVLECMRYRLFREEQLDSIIEDIEHISSDITLKFIADTLNNLEDNPQNTQMLHLLLYNFINRRYSLETDEYLKVFHKLLDKSRKYLKKSEFDGLHKQISEVTNLF
ncbi:helix-turn-helix domain-containing protein [Tissierella praeacuta]|uniref:helix-turn-helix domain-containing protein n=1 Tax=Tissierella praeacuta TaxID=43131 RepID=UPI003DA68D68